MLRVALLVLTIAGLVIARPATAQVTQATDRVEEDWKLVVATPDVAGVGPQITTSMCPAADRTQAPFVAFDLNYREYPSFAPGGYQAQVWSGGQLLQNSTVGKTDQFATANETVTWTQRMSLSDGRVSYAIVSGSSTTWGDFGSSVSVSFTSSLASLSGYDPAISAANSGVSWQVNNVQELTLVATRYYANGVLLSTDTTQRKLVSNGIASSSTSTATCPGPQTFQPRMNRRFEAATMALAPGRSRRSPGRKT
jgi:hypothetical protein